MNISVLSRGGSTIYNKKSQNKSRTMINCQYKQVS